MIIQAAPVKDSFNKLKSKLDKNEKVFYTRFGDGEIISMMGRNHRNYNASPGLTRELTASFLIDDPNYLVALSINYPKEKKMSKGVFAPFGINDELAGFLIENNLVINNGKYENPLVFHYMAAFQSKQMFQFFEQHIRPKRKMFIGCTSKETAEKLYGPIDAYIQVPPRHAYDSIDEWWPGIEAKIEQVDLIIPSAGAASNVVSKRIWDMNLDVCLLDIGSLVDAIDNKSSRTWIRLVGHKTRKILPRHHREQNMGTKLNPT